MTTNDTPFRTSFVLILLVAACSAGDSHTNSTPISTASEPTTISTNTSDNTIQPLSDRAPPRVTKEGRNEPMKNDTSPEQTSTPVPQSTAHLQTTKSSKILPPTTKSTAENSNTVIIFVSLLILMVLLIIAGCAHAMWDPEARPNSCLYRFIVCVRNGLRDLEDQVGLRSRGKIEEEDVTVEEGPGEDGDREDDHSHDPSATECNGQSETVLSGGGEEKKQKEDEEEETSSESESSLCDVGRERSGAKKEESEEIALVNSPQEHDEMLDLCDVTVL
ncbi:uncharacterized protein V6R79_025897 [Siganus canaliculatus]